MYKWIMLVLLSAACALGIGYVVYQSITSTAEEIEIIDETKPVDIAAAEAVFQQSCITCHGVDLEGISGPNLQHVGTTMTKKEILNKINRGGNGMPPFKDSLNKEEVNNLAGWLAEKL